MKKACLIILLLCGIKAKSQVIVVQTINPIQTRYADCWTSKIINHEVASKVYAMLQVQRDGKPYLEVKTRPFFLALDQTELQFEQIQIEQYMTKPSGNFSWHGFLSTGNYQICLRIVFIENPFEGESCFPLDILPLSPPMLISPLDKSDVSIFPILTWMPPMPMNIYEGLNYDLKVVEIFPMQSGYEAMASNLPLMNQSNLEELSYPYSSSNAPLEPGKNYAWQIIAKDKGKIIGKTEVWQFHIAKDSIRVKDEIIPEYYYILSDKNSPRNMGTAKGCVGFTCAQAELKNFTFQLVNKTGQVVDGEFKLSKAPQNNYFIIKLSDNKDIKPNMQYTLVVTNGSGEKYFLEFIYKKPDLK